MKSGFSSWRYEDARRWAMMIIIAALSPFWIILGHRAAAPALLLLGFLAAAQSRFWQMAVAPYVRNVDFRMPLTRLLCCAGLFVFWIMLSGIWSPEEGALKLGLNIAAPMLASIALIWDLNKVPSHQIKLPVKPIAIIAITAMGLMVFESLSNGMIRAITPPEDTSINRFRDMVALGRGTTILVQLGFPSLLLIYFAFRNRILVIACAAMLAHLIIEFWH